MSAMKDMLADMKYDFEHGLSIRQVAAKYHLPYKRAFMALLECMENLEGE